MGKKFKILFVAEELAVNGAMRSLIALLKAIPSEKYDVSLFLFNPGGQMMAEIPDNITILPVSLPYAAHRMPLKQALNRMLRKWRIDLILYRFLVSFQRYFGLKYRLWPFLPRIKGEYDVACCYTDGFVAPLIMHKVTAKRKVCWIHFNYSDYPQPQYVYEALKQADLCATVSYDVGNALDKVLGIEKKKHIVHNITDASECIKKAEESCEIPHKGDVFRIVTVGRVTSAKCVELFPDIARKLKDSGLFFEWYVVGNGDLLQTSIERTRNYGLEECLHFIGSRDNPYPWVKSADVIVNPSKSESWGMTVSEALCLGKAVIVSDIPVFNEQVINGVNGLICNSTYQVIAEAILKIYNNADLKDRLEKNARNYPYTKERIVEEFDELVNSLLEVQ